MKLSEADFSEPEQIGSSAESLQRSFDSQRELFHSQIDQLQRLVIVQCQLTGVNPLAQEMAAGALSIKIGKRPRDLLNPKAVKYMQSIFSIKDAVTKKECREISALFGVTVTQVREFFATQRSRVRKLVTLSRERAIRSNSLLELQDETQTNFDPLVPINIVPLNTIDPTKDEEPPSCSTEDDVLSGIDDLDKQFVESIFSLMRKEETFSGQVKLMEWILRIQNSAVLCWFLSRGGIMILATWLSQAAAEEQTSFLLVILNVLCHLPLNKALPVHMSAILQSVNRLRFYKTSDISNRARVLLSNWSKSLARSQALKKPNGTKTFIDEQQELILKQSLSDVIADESWQSSIDAPENILGSSDDFWKSETTQVLRLLPASSDDPNKKLLLGASSSQTRERRKVQLVEQPGQKTAGRSPQATRAAASNHSRPMSADDIQKAKMRAQFMQSKYRKASESNTNKKLKTELLNNPSTSAIGTLPPAHKVVVQPKLEEQKQSVPLLPLKVPNPLEDSLGLNPRKDRKEPLLEKCTRVQISWKSPSEIRLDHPWRVGAGENSKEVEIQRNRNRREKETVYRTIQEIPPNPKEPWDSEMDYDDSLTPVITIEQMPEAEVAVTQAPPNPNPNLEPQNGVISNSRVSNVSTAEPDLELLAVLLKNPELVIALTSGQAANLPPTETMKLLDMIKVGASATVSSFNAASQKVEDKVEVSLPSPTPLIDPGTCARRPEAVRNPFSQLNAASSNQSLPAMHFAPPQYSQQPKTMVQEKYSPLDGPRSTHKISLNTFSSVQTNSHSPSNSNVRLPSTNNSFANSDERFRVSGTATTSAAAAAHSKNGNHGPDFWRPGQNLPPNYNNSLSNQNISYNSESRGSYRGPGPAHVSQANGPQWDRNEYAAEGRSYESWSPDNSPTRNSRDYAMMGRNFPEPRMSYRPAADQSRARDSSNSGYTDYNNRYGDRKWRDRRR